MNARVREVVTANGGEIAGEEYFPLDHADYRETVDRITSTGAGTRGGITLDRRGLWLWARSGTGRSLRLRVCERGADVGPRAWGLLPNSWPGLAAGMDVARAGVASSGAPGAGRVSPRTRRYRGP